MIIYEAICTKKSTTSIHNFTYSTSKHRVNYYPIFFFYVHDEVYSRNRKWWLIRILYDHHHPIIGFFFIYSFFIKRLHKGNDAKPDLWFAKVHRYARVQRWCSLIFAVIKWLIEQRKIVVHSKEEVSFFVHFCDHLFLSVLHTDPSSIPSVSRVQ